MQNSTSKLKFNRRDWKPDGCPYHRFDIFMVNADIVCECGSDCCSGVKHIQRCVTPSITGVPNFNKAQDFMTPDEIQWCHDENKALLEIFPKEHEFWTKGL